MKVKKKNRYVPPKELRPVHKFKRDLVRKGVDRSFIKAFYYYDHSGVIEVRHKGYSIYETESGTIDCHIDEIQTKINEMKEEIETLQRAFVILDREYYEMDEPFKTAEAYLESLK